MQRDLRAIQYLAAMPFLDRLELAAVSNTADRTMHDIVADLNDRELVALIRHSTDLIASTRRLYVTEFGLHWLAEQEDEDVLDLLHHYPVSRHWQRVLLERLDAVGVIYRLASHVAEERGAIRFKWYRRSPLDAAVYLPDGRAIGIVRQGVTSDRTGFSKRIWRLLETGPARPDALLVVVPDEMRMRHASKLFERARAPMGLFPIFGIACRSSDCIHTLVCWSDFHVGRLISNTSVVASANVGIAGAAPLETGSSPPAIEVLSSAALTRACASPVAGYPPRPMSVRRPSTMVRRIHDFDPPARTVRYRPPPSPYRPDLLRAFTLAEDSFVMVSLLHVL